MWEGYFCILNRWDAAFPWVQGAFANAGVVRESTAGISNAVRMASNIGGFGLFFAESVKTTFSTCGSIPRPW